MKQTRDSEAMVYDFLVELADGLELMTCLVVGVPDSENTVIVCAEGFRRLKQLVGVKQTKFGFRAKLMLNPQGGKSKYAIAHGNQILCLLDEPVTKSEEPETPAPPAPTPAPQTKEVVPTRLRELASDLWKRMKELSEPTQDEIATIEAAINGLGLRILEKEDRELAETLRDQAIKVLVEHKQAAMIEQFAELLKEGDEAIQIAAMLGGTPLITRDGATYQVSTGSREEGIHNIAEAVGAVEPGNGTEG